MKKLISLLLAAILILSLAACGAEKKDAKTSDAPKTTENGKSIVVYFSRTGEQYKVGVIEKGNTAIVAEAVAQQTGADLFEIVPKEDNYPTTYKELTEFAKEGQNKNARPEIKDTVKDFGSYDIVYLGYPIWWNDLPMICYTFLESYDFSGKTVVPFCTHEGSGDADTAAKIKAAIPKAEVTDVLALTGSDAQNKPDAVSSAVKDWLKK